MKERKKIRFKHSTAMMIEHWKIKENDYDIYP